MMRVCSFIFILVLPNLFVESDACLDGCACNIFCCNCAIPFPSIDPPCIVPCAPLASDKDAAVQKSVEECCNKKEVGGVSYTLVPGLPDPETHPRHCIDGCVYTQDGTTTEFCFAKGNLKVECGDQSPVSIDGGSNGTLIDTAGANGNCKAILSDGKCFVTANNCKKGSMPLASTDQQCKTCKCVTTIGG